MSEPVELTYTPVEIEFECPHNDGPFHLWSCDGPFTVTCDNCDADGRITMTSGPEEE